MLRKGARAGRRAKSGCPEGRAAPGVGVDLGWGEGVGGGWGQSKCLAGPFHPGGVRDARLHPWAGSGGAQCVLEEVAWVLAVATNEMEKLRANGP